MAELTGYSYPLDIDPETKSLRLATDEDYIRRLILSFAETEIRERLGIPNYGIPNFLFNAYQTFGFAGQQIQQKLTASIPQASFDVRSSIDDEGNGLIEIFWQYQGTEQTPIRLQIARDTNG